MKKNLPYNKENIKELLERSPKAVLKAVQTIYEYQTAEEQGTRETNENNGVGFNGIDAQIMSSFAEQLNNNRTLSSKQFEIAKKKIMKYSGQLAKISNQKWLEKNNNVAV